LHPKFAFLHKLSPFEYEGGLNEVFKLSAEAYKFQTWPQYVETAPLDDEIKRNIPFFMDGLVVWSVMHKFFEAYFDLYYKKDDEVLADKDLHEYWKFALVPQYQQGLPTLSKRALVDQVTHSCFFVTAWHEIVGALVPYVTSPDGMFYSVRKTEPPQTRADAHHLMSTLCLTSATGARMPQYLQDWGHLLRDDEARKLQMQLLKDLEDVSRNKLMDRKSFNDFDPVKWECSVSV